MCGITGFFSSEREIDTSQYYESHRLIKHRGPDDEGFIALLGNELKTLIGDDTISHFHGLNHINSVKRSRMILGHRRLSIIDLTYHGHQPFCDESGNYWITYNGEIYNYLELRKELIALGYLFLTDSDTEVLLKAYMHWGTDAFNKFNGMWSFAIYSKKDNSLLLCRDRFGIKPLFYCIMNGVLYFSSEMKFIRAFAHEKFTVNKASVNNYLYRGLLNSSEHTFWNEIKELQPAHFIVYENSSITRNEKYWTFEPHNANFSEKEALEKFSYIFEDSLKLRMRSDVEVGSLLSGGLDSNLLISTLDKLGFIKDNNFKSFSAIFNETEFSEKQYIDETLKRVNLKPYFVYPKASELERTIDKLCFHIEEPFRSLSVYSQFCLYNTISSDSKVKVVLNGQGADELFGGYTSHYYYLFASLLKRFRLLKLIFEIYLLKHQRNAKYSTIFRTLMGRFLESLRIPNYFNAMTFTEISKSALREYLTYEDRNSMSFGIESRLPFMDYRLVEFAFSLDEEYKIDNFVNKRIVREYAKGSVADSIIQRKDKTGFISPQELWQKGVLADSFNTVFAGIKKRGVFDFLDTDKLSRSYVEYKNGTLTEWSFIWRIYCLEKWKISTGGSNHE